MIQYRIKSIGIIILLTLYSCTGVKYEQSEIEEISNSEIKRRMNEKYALIETFTAEGSIAFESPQSSHSGYIEIRIKKPDSIYIKLEGPFGIDIATALITRKNFIYYKVEENKVIRGLSNDINIGAILKVKVGFDELIECITGAFKFTSDMSDSNVAKLEDGNYIIEFNDEDDGIKKFIIEPINLHLSNYSRYHRQNIKLFDVRYSNYKVGRISERDISYPLNIKISKLDSRQTIWLNYYEVEFNKKDLKFRINVPKSAEEIEWNQILKF